jgi:hypothetical protein
MTHRTHRNTKLAARLQWLRTPILGETILTKAVRLLVPTASLRSPAAEKDSFLLRIARVARVDLED